MDKDTQTLVVRLRSDAPMYQLPKSLLSEAADLIEKQAGILEHVQITALMHAEADWEREQQTEGEG